MKIAAADADGPGADKDVVILDDARRRDVADLERSDCGQEGGFHGFLIIEQMGRIREGLSPDRPNRAFDIGPAA